jgi:branched-chain amino acid transport system permease protein
LKGPLRWVGLAGWAGLLAVPLTGPWRAVQIAAVTFAGCLLWAGSVRLGASSAARGALRRMAGKLSDRRRLRVPTALRWKLTAGWLAALALLPIGLNDYYLDVLVLAGLYVVLALGLNIVVGVAGLLDLGYISFYAIGAYTYALLSTKFGVSFWLALPLGGAAAAVLGAFLGIVTLRLRGDYLAIVTLGFIHIVHLVLNNWDSVTNGPNGIIGIARPAIAGFVFSRPIHFYYLILLIASLTVFAMNRLNSSRIGRGWIAMREDEIAAEAMGVDTTRMKILAFTLGAAWAGIAGVFFAGKFAFISPESFTFLETVFVLSMVVLGGMGSVPGVILGALILVILPEVLRDFASYRMLLFGAAMVFMMIFRPQGLIGNPRRRVEFETVAEGEGANP